MTIFYRAWRHAVAERNALRAVRDQLVVDLVAERARSSSAALMATAECASCVQLEADLADALQERDQWQAASQYQERIGFAGVRADGEAM